MHDLLVTAVQNPAVQDQQPSMSVLLDILRQISDRTTAYGCILWQEIPPEGGSGEPQLFVLADWMDDGRHCANHDMPIASSRTGRAIETKRQIVVRKVPTTMANSETFDRFLEEAKIQTFCTTPICFEDGRRGAVNIYRNVPKPFDQETRAVAREVAPLVPLLYEMIRTRVSSALLRKVTEITRSFDPQLPEGSTPYEHAKISIADICEAVANAFNCLEVSVFFEDPIRAEREFELVATTDDSLARKRIYQAGDEHGITGWTLAHPDEKVRIFDLANADVIAKVYKGMHWKDSWQIAEIVGKRMVPEGAPLPPLSFMAAPILRGSRVIGVIRCSVAKGPWYFAPGDHSILEMVASHLGSFWGTILDRREVDTETNALKKLVEHMVNLNEVADTEITKSSVDDRSILTAAVRITRSVIPGATITDIRLLNDERTELQFVTSDRGAAEDVSVPQFSYPLADGSRGSAGSYVVHTGSVCEIDDVANDPYYAKHYPGAKRIIVAPIQLRDSTGHRDLYGVLDVCSNSAQPFPVFAHDSAVLLSSQLALYKKLGATVRNLNEINQVHIRLTEDMAHQLMSPLLIAKGRVQDSLKAAASDQAMTSRLLEVRGAIGRVLHVCSNLDTFVRLERGRDVPVVLEDMTGGDLIAILINTSKDASRLRDSFLVYGNRPIRSLWDGSFTPRRRLVRGRFEVKREGFQKVEKIRTDRRLLEQVLTQVLDNAFKYSYVGSTVEVEGGYTAATRKRDMMERQRSRTPSLPPAGGEERRRRIRISVINEGIDLTEDDARTVTERGVQADHAQVYSQGGSGIGLWIVRELMKALGGELDIHPTDGKHKTEITLLFPVE